MKRLFLFLMIFFTTAGIITGQRLQINITERNNINQLFKKDVLINNLDSVFTYGWDEKIVSRHWSKKDLSEFGSPYDILTYGFNGQGVSFLNPVFLGAIDMVPEEKYLIKIGFLPEADSMKGNMGRVLNLIANYDKERDAFTFERYTNYFTKDWYKIQVGNILFYKENRESFNLIEAKACNRYNDIIAAVFKMTPEKITYYSCKEPIQMFNLMGFDFRYEMFLSRTGGMRINDALYSARNAEHYPHEIVHFYVRKLQGTNVPCTIASEGIPTYFGGSDPKSFKETTRSLFRYLQKYKEVPVERLLFDDVRTDDDVSRLYAVGGVLAKVIYEKHGLEGWKKWLAIPCNKMIEELPKLLDTNKNLKQVLLEAAAKML